MSLLAPLLANTLSTSAAAPLVIISDTLLQPGLLLLRQCILAAAQRNEAVIVIALEQLPSRLIPRNATVDLIDCVSAPPFASTSTLPSGQIDIHANGGLNTLRNEILEKIKIRSAEGRKICVVIDSVDSLAERGVHKVFSLFRTIFSQLQGNLGSRLITLQHSAWPTSALTQPHTLTPNLLSTLLSPSLCSCTAQLILHPAELIELLSRDYSLKIPLQPTSTNSIDLRLTDFLTSFNSRYYGDPFIRPNSSTDSDERISLDVGGKFGKGCCVEISARGFSNLPTLPGPKLASRVSGKLGETGETKKIVTRGLEAIRRTADGIEIVSLEKVLDANLMKSVNLPEQFQAEATAAKSSSQTAETPLPFKLSLTDSQQAARGEVELPYMAKLGGGVEYSPDAGDDMDDDDPDDDLEV